MDICTYALARPLSWLTHCLEDTFVPPEESEGTLSRTATLAKKLIQTIGLLPCIAVAVPFSALSYLTYGLSQLFNNAQILTPEDTPIPTDKTLEFFGTATAEMQLRPRDHNNNNWSDDIPQSIKDTVYVSKDAELQMVTELVQSGMTAYRFSIEQSEIQNSDGTFNQAAIDEVKERIKAFKAAGIKTITLTTHHFTDPKDRSFEDTKTITHFVAYFTRMFAEFSHGDAKVDHICTINEPNVYSWMGWGFFQRPYPPHKFNPYLAGKVLRNLLTAHMQCMRAIKDHPNRKNVMVGFSHQALSFSEYHKGTSPLEGLVCRFLGEIHTSILCFMKDGKFTYRVPFCANIVEQIADPGELIGDCFFLQSYGEPALCWNPFSLNPQNWFTSALYPGEERNDFDFRIDSQDLLRTLRECQDMGRNIPIIISENGIPARETPDGNRKRSLYMAGAMNAVAQALQQGIPLRGYYHWSLVDNYEWAKNDHDIRFGIFYEESKDVYKIKEGAKPFLNTVCTWKREKIRH